MLLAGEYESALLHSYRLAKDKLGPLQFANRRIVDLERENQRLRARISQLEEVNANLANPKDDPDLPLMLRIRNIQKTVAHFYDVSVADILSARRSAHIVKPRQIAMYLSKKRTLRSLPEIGRRFGGKDHTTVLHAVRKVENKLTDPDWKHELEVLEERLGL